MIAVVLVVAAMNPVNIDHVRIDIQEIKRKVKEIVVISGKGGTGKTSIVASFASLAQNAVLADCDVDAADLHLVLDPHIKRSQDFYGGKKAYIDPEKCTGCGMCVEMCRFEAIIEDGKLKNQDSNIYKIDPIGCEGCGVCAYFCPVTAITMEPQKNGKLFISEMRYGPMVHAKLGIAEENTGKLVALVRENAREIARKEGADYIIVDGPPGVGCPVISSITGADIILIVTEPTVSGLSDLKRVEKLARHFNIPATVCINKWDINPSISEKICDYCDKHQIRVLGKIRYDNAFTKAQIMKATIPEYTSGYLADEIKSVWGRLQQQLIELPSAIQ